LKIFQCDPEGEDSERGVREEPNGRGIAGDGAEIAQMKPFCGGRGGGGHQERQNRNRKKNYTGGSPLPRNGKGVGDHPGTTQGCAIRVNRRA